MTKKQMSGFDHIVTPEKWKTELLSNTTKKRYSHFKLRTVFAVALVVVIVLAATVTAFAAAIPQFREWLLSVVNITQSITEVDGTANIVKTHDFGNEYLVRDGFVITNEGTPAQQVFEYAGGDMRNSDIKTCEGTYDQNGETLRFSFRYAKNGAELYAFDQSGDVDFIVENMHTTDDVAAVYFLAPPKGALVVVELLSGEVLREINIPGKMKHVIFSNDGTYALLKLSTDEDGAFRWYVTDMQTGEGSFIDASEDVYDAYFYNGTQIILMSFNEAEGMYLPLLYEIETGSVTNLKEILMEEYIVDYSLPYAHRLKDGKYDFYHIVNETVTSFDVSGLFTQEDTSATYGGGRFFFCDYGGSTAIFDMQNEMMTTIRPEDFQSDHLLFPQLVDENTLLVCGEKEGNDTPSFYLMQLQK